MSEEKTAGLQEAYGAMVLLEHGLELIQRATVQFASLDVTEDELAEIRRAVNERHERLVKRFGGVV